MTNESLEEIMVTNYAHVFKELLLSAFKANPDLTPEYLSEPMQRQREIENEVSKQSKEMASSLVRRMKQKGYLTMEPNESEIESLIKETLREFGVQI